MGFVLFGGNFVGASISPRCTTLADPGRLTTGSDATRYRYASPTTMKAKEQEKSAPGARGSLREEHAPTQRNRVGQGTSQARRQSRCAEVAPRNGSHGRRTGRHWSGQHGQFIFCDCSAESPVGRRSACYDGEALESRKENKPANSAVEMAAAMGIDLLTEEQYRDLQKLGDFDTKTSSWVRTPSEVRALGGALFCDRRYGKVFVYHNGAQSYYAARGFRGSLRV